MPDNFIYHYQALLAGLMALAAGALGFWAAVRALAQRREENSARQTNFVISVVVKLKIFESDVADLFDAFSHHAERMQDDPSYYPRPDSFDTIRLPLVLKEIWKLDVGLPVPIIIDIEELADSVSSACESIEGFLGALKRARAPKGTPSQLEFDNCRELLSNDQHDLFQLVCAARDWVGEVQKQVAASSEHMINHFSIDKRSIETLCRKRDEE